VEELGHAVAQGLLGGFDDGRLTDPAIRPSAATAIFEPAARGAEPQVWTTVARAIALPSRVQASISAPTSFMPSSEPAGYGRERSTAASGRVPG
jgi:hypothetical protein